MVDVDSPDVEVVVWIASLELVVGSFELAVVPAVEATVLNVVACVVSPEVNAVVCTVVSALLVVVVSSNTLDETILLLNVAVLVVDSPNVAELVVPIVFDESEDRVLTMDVWKPLLLSVEKIEEGVSIGLSVVEVKLVDSTVFDGLDEVTFRIDV